MLKLITDSVSDISLEEELSYGVRVLPYPVVIGGRSYLSRVELSNQEFYELMAQYPEEVPTTSQITTFALQEVMEEEVAAGNEELIFVLINAKGSATFDNACMAKERFFEEHPELRDRVKIDVVDSRGYMTIYGVVVIEAAKMAQNGASCEQVTAYVHEALEKRMIYFSMYSLKYAAKSGRITAAAAFRGEKLGLKPIMKIFDHEIVTAAKVRDEKRMMEQLVDMACRDMKPGAPYQVMCGANLEDRDKLQQMMEDRLGYAPTGGYQICPAIAANAGPKAIGVSFDIS